MAMLTLTLKNKILLLTTGLIMVLGLSIIIFVRASLTKTLFVEYEGKGIALATYLSEVITGDVLTRNMTDLRMKVKEYKNAGREIKYIFIQDEDGEVLAHTFPGGVPSELKKVTVPAPGKKYRVQSLHTEEGHIFNVAVIMMGGEAGTVHIGFSHEHCMVIVADKVRSLVGIIIIFLIAGGVTAVVFSKLITKPLFKLAEVSTEIGNGNLDRKVHIDTQDEIGQLGNTFNKMTENLRNKTVSLDYMENILGSMIDPLIVISPDGIILKTNKAANGLLGYTEKELVGQTFNIILEEHLLFSGLRKNNAFPGELSCTHERSYVNKEGRSIPVLLSASAVYKEDVFQGWVCVAQNITEQKQVEEVLRDSERNYRQLVDNAPIAIYRSTIKGRFLFANNAFLKLAGFETLDEFISEPVLNRYVYPQQRETFIRNLMKNGRVDNFPVKSITKEGKHIDTLVTATHNGEIILGMILDITELRKAEEERKAFTRQLEQSNSELRNFLSIASHDLQEPLRKVIFFGNRLDEKYAGVIGAKGRDNISRMMNATTRMQLLIDSLREYSHVSLRAKAFTSVNLSAIAHEVLSDLEVRIDQTGARVELDDLPTIDADPLQMRQLFQNLLGNALKFHKPGEPPVVKVSGETPDTQSRNRIPSFDGTCRITVEDNGIGFDEKYTDRIFGVFQRLHGKSEYEGTGIGLSVCKKIVERHGGSIEAKGRSGEGAAFIITLPQRHDREESHD